MSFAAFDGTRRVPSAVNEPVRSYAPHSPERVSLKRRIAAMEAERVEIPIVIGGKRIHTGNTGTQVMPHMHSHVVADYHKARTEDVTAAIAAATAAQKEWAAWSWEDRAGIPSQVMWQTTKKKDSPVKSQDN